jgi:hypothetical protein
MDFEARRLRVQLPCGDETLIACVFGTCRLPSRITCLWWTCPPWLSMCKWTTDFCRWHTDFCPLGTEIVCRVGTLPIPGCGLTELVQVDLDDLPILQEQLEGQLKAVLEAIEVVNKQRNKG